MLIEFNNPFTVNLNAYKGSLVVALTTEHRPGYGLTAADGKTLIKVFEEGHPSDLQAWYIIRPPKDVPDVYYVKTYDPYGGGTYRLEVTHDGLSFGLMDGTKLLYVTFEDDDE